MSNVTYNSENYSINYCHGNTLYELKISRKGVKNLYTLIMNIIQEKIMGTDGKYRTLGHYDGIMRTLYAEMVMKITQISDDIGTSLLPISEGLKLRSGGRYSVENPRIIDEDNVSITFSHIENNNTDDENSSQYYFSTDYIYEQYLLPQEIGVITKGEGASFQERMKSATNRNWS